MSFSRRARDILRVVLPSVAVAVLLLLAWRDLPPTRIYGATGPATLAVISPPSMAASVFDAPASSTNQSAAFMPASLAALRGPLRERLAGLRELAERGNPEAACRLALELNTCRGLHHREKLSTFIESVAYRRPPSPADTDLVDTVASAREGAAAGALHCAGVDDEGENDTLALLHASVLRGSTRQRVVAALMQPDGSLLRLPRGPGNVMPMDLWFNGPASQFYADHTLEFLAEGYRARDPLALEGLILLHAPDLLQPGASTDVAFRLPDPRRFAGLALLAERVYGPEMLGAQVRNLLQRVLERMSGEARAQLEIQVDLEAAGWASRAGRALTNSDRLSPELLDELCR